MLFSKRKSVLYHFRQNIDRLTPQLDDAPTTKQAVFLLTMALISLTLLLLTQVNKI